MKSLGKRYSGTLNRRQMLKLLGATSLGAAFVGPQSVMAENDREQNQSHVVKITLLANERDTGPGPKALRKVLNAFEDKQNHRIKVDVTFDVSVDEIVIENKDARPVSFKEPYYDVYAYFGGLRMRSFAEAGIISPVSYAVMNELGPQIPSGVQQVVKSTDGRTYMVPFKTYPWVFYYNKKILKPEHVPRTWNQLIETLTELKKKKIPSMVFTNDGGWPAMATFDILNMRINGYQYHMQLMAGEKSWDSPGVKAVFKHWRKLKSFYQADENKDGWSNIDPRDCMRKIRDQEAGLFFAGAFQARNIMAAPEDSEAQDRERTKKFLKDDIGLFAFPEINARWGQQSIDAPIDGFMVGRTVKDREREAVDELLKYLGSKAAFDTYNKSYGGEAPAHLSVHMMVENKTSNNFEYDRLQKEEKNVLASSTNFAQFMDRDMDKHFANNVVSANIKNFLENRNSVDEIAEQIEVERRKKYSGDRTRSGSRSL